jgi:hypothetical protein
MNDTEIDTVKSLTAMAHREQAGNHPIDTPPARIITEGVLNNKLRI